MNFQNKNTTHFFSSVTEVPQTIWDSLECTNNLYFHPDYLFSIEKNNPQITFFYIVLTDKHKKAIALASLQLIEVPLNSIEDSLNKNKVFHKLKCFGRKLGVFPELKPIKVLVCGNTFVSGEHGIFIQKHLNKQLILKKIAKAMLLLVNSDTSLNKEISIFLMKDFIKESRIITDELLDLNYYSFNVEPNMVLKMNPEWQTFHDYLNALKTKFRVKAKRALNLSSDLHIEKVTAENSKKHLPEITRLYKKVASNANFNLGNFNLQSYVSLLEKFPKKYFLHLYLYDKKVVGFLSGMINETSLDAHFVGIDYQKNKLLAIYQRMLYDYINIAIERQLKVINFGRTASEIKSSIGAVPEHLTCYLRHKKSLTNKFLKPFLKHIEPTPFQQKFPFKLEKKQE